MLPSLAPQVALEEIAVTVAPDKFIIVRVADAEMQLFASFIVTV